MVQFYPWETVSARGLLRPQGHGQSTFYYTLRRAAVARQVGGISAGFDSAAFEAGKEVGSSVAEQTWSPLVSVNAAQGAAELINEMGAEMSADTYHYVVEAQNSLGALQDEFQRRGCK